MAEPIIQADYPQLRDLVRQFESQADYCADLRANICSKYQPLQQGGWLGKGATAFFSEMDDDIFPALDRMHTVLTLSSATIQDVIAIFQAAEEEAAQIFQTSGDGSAEEHIEIHDTDDKTITSEKETKAQREANADRVFNKSYMDQMIDRTWKGENDERLGKAMEALLKNPSAADKNKALDTIAELRGLDRATVAQQYETFQALREQSGAVEDILPILHHGYMGSRDQLRFGQVVGGVLGIDPVFGAMLNPTGGMPGPGEKAIPSDFSHLGIPISNPTLSYHSAFHDGAGFLYNHFGVGPGYNYLGAEKRPTDNPLTGQESGIAYWNSKFIISEIRNGQLDRYDVLGAIVTTTGGVVLGAAEDFYNLYGSAQSLMDLIF